MMFLNGLTSNFPPEENNYEINMQKTNVWRPGCLMHDFVT